MLIYNYEVSILFIILSVHIILSSVKRIIHLCNMHVGSSVKQSYNVGITKRQGTIMILLTDCADLLLTFCWIDRCVIVKCEFK